MSLIASCVYTLVYDFNVIRRLFLCVRLICCFAAINGAYIVSKHGQGTWQTWCCLGWGWCCSPQAKSTRCPKETLIQGCFGGSFGTEEAQDFCMCIAWVFHTSLARPGALTCRIAFFQCPSSTGIHVHPRWRSSIDEQVQRAGQRRWLNCLYCLSKSPCQV